MKIKRPKNEAERECVVASSNVDFISDPTDRSAVALNESMKRASESEIINPFFTT